MEREFQRISVGRILTLGLIAIVLLYWYDTSLWNPIAIAELILLVFHFVRQGRILGMVVGGLFTLISLYMFLALFSEFGGFHFSQSSDFWYGFTYFSITLGLSVATFFMHFSQQKMSPNVIETSI